MQSWAHHIIVLQDLCVELNVIRVVSTHTFGLDREYTGS